MKSGEAFSEQAEEIFCAAMEVEDSAERKAMVIRACAGEAKLLAQVEALLSAQPEVNRLFEGSTPALARLEELHGEKEDVPALSEEDLPSPEEKLGSRIGPYKLLEVIGEGGCGVVYMAEQEEPVRRRVALKIIKLGMDTRSVIARFGAERQALALMDHPNIAHVLDAGATEAGRPYFVMELVRGVKITTFCDQRQFDTRQRLDLFIQVCHAIQHAHQKGIIHRDIKPSNILVTMHDGVPMPMVIDFGIAKAIEGRLTDLTLFTSYDQFIGTPAYMSPEQAEMSRLDVDTRSDIYSLGVLLYELLTGRTPFETKTLMQSGLDEMRRTLREREPLRPSSVVTTLKAEELTQAAQARSAEPPRLVSLLKGDLDWIVMKALEKDRNRRYQTANAIAMDVQRYLDTEPVLARPPSQFYRLRKLVRRNKVVFLSGAAVVIALAAGLGISLALYMRERDLRNRAVAAEQEQARLRIIAERGFVTEAELRRQAEWRENIRQAALLLSHKAYSEADQLVAQMSSEPSTMEGAEVLRTLGEWNVVQQHWLAAKDRFLALQRASRLDNPVNTSLDSTRAAVAIIESSSLEEYDRFCQETVETFGATDDPIVAGRALRNCLLQPASAGLIQSLRPLAQCAKKSLEGIDFSNRPVNWQTAWRCHVLALWAYRAGNFAEAQTWCERCLQGDNHPPVRATSARLIEAMSLQQLGKTDEANSLLKRARNEIEAKFAKPLGVGDSDSGVWFDWVIARILLREADASFGTTPETAD